MHTNFNSKHIIGEYETRRKLLEPPMPETIKNRQIMVNNRSISLTGREVDCLNKLTLGYSAKEIAKLLALSPRTVEDYIQNAKGKMGYSKKSDLVRIMRSQEHTKLFT
jgi:DNA-binding CsgD family transcriptional regulator